MNGDIKGVGIKMKTMEVICVKSLRKNMDRIHSMNHEYFGYPPSCQVSKKGGN